MHSTATTLLVLQCTLCLSIKVPVTWNEDNSEVNENKQFSVETIQTQNVVSNKRKPIPTEYFEYTAQKPKFAVDIARLHGVQSPENHYKAYPVKPYTGIAKPELGKHQILDTNKNVFRPFQEYVKKTEGERYVLPSTTSYEVFHPYKLEEPALKELYQDPVMDKIRNDLLTSRNRLQKHENEAGVPHVTKNEYLENHEETDRKKLPHQNVPATYEIHRPQRRPVYYRPSIINNYREYGLNQKLRHPWHQNYVKVKPMHYRPIKNHLQKLRQQHALKYDDEHNEYPQVLPPEKYSELSDGHDIYEKGKAKFVQLRNNVDESINEAVQNNRPIIEQKLELNNYESDEHTNTNEEDQFVPIKNYAQVRKTDTTKYVPKEAAFYDADTLDEIENAPRLREAIKSTKAQTVYSEEGYEDSAYDHAGEQKHASDHEGHGGFLKEKEHSKSKFKTPSLSGQFQDGQGLEYRDKVLDGKKWKENNKDTDEETESEEYSENEQDHFEDSNIYSHLPKNTDSTQGEITKGNENISLQDEENERQKREETTYGNTNVKNQVENQKNISEHDVIKREIEILSPKSNLNATYLTDISLLSKSKVNKVEKYPYYHKKIKAISKDSPLKYAENLKLIPIKSKGGTEFYDSRSKFKCPEVDDNVDPIPDKLKKGGHPDEIDDDEDGDEDDDDENNKSKSDFSILEKKPRLHDLGDKIDCFKAKYFGVNPLDSPFFNEEIISNPEPVTVPNLEVYKLKQAKEQAAQESKINESLNLKTELKKKDETNNYTIIDKLYPKQNFEITSTEKTIALVSKVASINKVLPENKIVLNSQVDLKYPQNVTYMNLQKKENVTTQNSTLRSKRAAPFVYEPYKIIRDSSQTQDSKKTTTTNNISPLIKQLQSNRVVERVTNNQRKDQIVKRNAGTRTYKDIGKTDREKNVGKGTKPLYDTSFVDVSVDQRRGEPRYELRPDNHKSEYTPVVNKKSMTKEDYKSHTNSNISSEEYDGTKNKNTPNRRRPTTTTTTIRPYFDVSKYLPHAEELEKRKLSEFKVEQQKKIEARSSTEKTLQNSETEEDYDEEEEYDEDEITNKEDLTTTTTKIPQRRRITSTSTTEKDNNEKGTETPKLQLVTRFRDLYHTDNPKTLLRTERPTPKSKDYEEEIAAPKYREKKKKSSKSTLVTDTKSYGEDDEDDDDLETEKVDALIGIKQDIKEYMPLYEKEVRKKNSSLKNHTENQDEKIVDDNEQDDQDHEEEDDEYEDEEDEENDDSDELDEEEDDENGENEEQKPEITTSEPTKRTLARTTEAPVITTEARSAKLEIKPVVVKKKIEIHKELPINRSSPHITEFKQDIKEVEIIREMPSKTKKKPQKNVEALELYKDENLAKDVNKLGGVEIFKEELDLVNGPKHGGNYRSAETLTKESVTSSSPPPEEHSIAKGDIVASQSKTSKLIEVKNDPYSSRRRDIQRARNNRGRNAKLIELSDATETPTSRSMHGGNFKSAQDGKRRDGSRNAKIIELDEHNSEEDQPTNTYGNDFKSFGSRSGGRNHMHGGNYRSAKLVQAESIKDKANTQSENVNDKIKDGRKNAAVLLSNFASAVPILTTTPAFILDPSKRMYYYVDA